MPTWDDSITYYMEEPADCLTSREYEAVFFVGPARTGKTRAIIDNWIAHNIEYDPADMKIYLPTEADASAFSKKRIDIDLMGDVPSIRSKLRPGAHNNNVLEKIFKPGVVLSMGYPSNSQLAGRDFVKVAFSDYDRIADNIGGEGSVFKRGQKRTQTYMSRGMSLAEGSPSRPVHDPKWKPETPHEAPPTSGLLGLFNTGDRRRLYGYCEHCCEFFMPECGIEAIWLPESASIEQAAADACLICTNCGETIDQHLERKFKKSGHWLKEGQEIDGFGNIEGEGVISKRASFWMPGWFAAFQTWESIVLGYLQAKQLFERTGDENELKTSVNVDMGAAYIEMARKSEGSIEEKLQDRAEPFERYCVPDGGRTLLASVDIQAGKDSRFEIIVTAIGKDREQWPIDYFCLRKSERDDQVDPAVYAEDWDLLTEKVLNATYRLPDGNEMRIARVIVDTGGAGSKNGGGVTANAYAWYRRVKALKLHSRVMLIKGASNKGGSKIRKSYPDSRDRKDRNTAKGDVPLYLLQTDMIKDSVWADVSRDIPGQGFIHFPDWLPPSFYKGLCAELRGPKGWEKISGRANEPFDLMTYIRAGWIDMGGDAINWDAPPFWAAEWDDNPLVISKEQRRTIKKPARRIRGRIA